jgi:hypothetical protein
MGKYIYVYSHGSWTTGKLGQETMLTGYGTDRHTHTAIYLLWFAQA